MTTNTSPLATLDICLPGFSTLDVNNPQSSSFLVSRQDWQYIFGFISEVVTCGPISWCPAYQPIHESVMSWRPCLSIIEGYVGQTMEYDFPGQIAGYAQPLLQDAMAVNELIVEQATGSTPTGELAKEYVAALERIETQLRGLLGAYEQDESLASKTASEFERWTSSLLKSVVLDPAQARALGTELSQTGAEYE
jgi:hypothetical protein